METLKQYEGGEWAKHPWVDCELFWGKPKFVWAYVEIVPQKPKIKKRKTKGEKQ